MRILSIIQPSEMGSDFRFEDDVWKVNFPTDMGGNGIPLSTDANNAIGLGSDNGAFISTDLLNSYALTQDNSSKKINLYRFPVGTVFDPETAVLVSSINLIELNGVFDDVAIDGSIITFTDADTGLTLAIDTANLQKVSDINGSDSINVMSEGGVTTLSVKVSQNPQNIIEVSEEGLFVPPPDDAYLHQTLSEVETGLLHVVGNSHLVVPQIELVDVTGKTIGYINDLIGLPVNSVPAPINNDNCHLGMLGVRFSSDMWYGDNGEVRWEVYINGVKTDYVATSNRTNPDLDGWLEGVIGPASNSRLRGDYSGGGCWFINTVEEQILVELKPTTKVDPSLFMERVTVGGLSEEDINTSTTSIKLNSEDFIDSDGNISLCINPHDLGIGKLYLNSGGTHPNDGEKPVQISLNIEYGTFDPDAVIITADNVNVSFVLDHVEGNYAYYNVILNSSDVEGYIEINAEYTYKESKKYATNGLEYYKPYTFTVPAVGKVRFVGEKITITDANAISTNPSYSFKTLKATIVSGTGVNISGNVINNGDDYQTSFQITGPSIEPVVIEFTAYDHKFKLVTVRQTLHIGELSTSPLTYLDGREIVDGGQIPIYSDLKFQPFVNGKPLSELDPELKEGIDYKPYIRLYNSTASGSYDDVYELIESDDPDFWAFYFFVYNNMYNRYGYQIGIRVFRDGVEVATKYNTVSKIRVIENTAVISEVKWDKDLYTDSDTIAVLTGKIDRKGQLDGGLVLIKDSTTSGEQIVIAESRTNADGSFRIELDLTSGVLTTNNTSVVLQVENMLFGYRINMFETRIIDLPLVSNTTFAIQGPAVILLDYLRKGSEIDWGDGTTEVYGTSDAKHTYPEGVFYLTFEVPRNNERAVYLNSKFYDNDNTAVIGIKDFGKVKSLPKLRYYPNIKTLPTELPRTVRYMDEFLYNTSLNPIEVEGWDLSLVVSLNSFAFNNPVFNRELINCNINPFVDIDGAFCNAVSFNQPLPLFIFDSTYNRTLYGTTSFNQDITHFIDRAETLGSTFIGESGISPENMFTSNNQRTDVFEIEDNMLYIKDFNTGHHLIKPVVIEGNDIPDYYFRDRVERKAWDRSRNADLYFPKHIERIGKFNIPTAYVFGKTYIPESVKVVDTGGLINIRTPIFEGNGLVELKDFALVVTDDSFVSGHTSLVLPTSLKKIGRGNIGITGTKPKYIVPTHIEEMHAYSFYPMTRYALMSLYFNTVQPPIINGVFNKRVTLYVPAEAVDVYKALPACVNCKVLAKE